MSPFHTKKSENKNPSENVDMIKVEESKNGYEIALDKLKWLFEPMPLKICLPTTYKYPNMPVEMQYMQTFKNLFNSANLLRKNLESGD